MNRAMIIALLVIGLLLPAPVLASGEDEVAVEVQNAINHLNMGFYKNAHNILLPYVNSNPMDLDANLQLGRYYLLVSEDGNAMKRFNAIMRQDPDRYRPLIGDCFAEATQLEAEKASPNCNRIYRFTVHAYTYNPHLAIDAESKLVAYGDAAKSQKQFACAEKFYDLAKQYGKENIKRTVAHRYLYLAALGHRTNALKKKAAEIVGDDFANKVIPGNQVKRVFTKTLTMADADEKAHVVPFVWGQVDVRVGDTIHVKVRDAKGVQKNVKFGLFRSKKICDIYENEKTINVVEIPKSGYKFKIALDDEIDNIAEIKIVRTIYLKPKIELLAMN
jgi:hypothetical protein